MLPNSVQKEVYISTELFWEQQYMAAVAASSVMLDPGLTGLKLPVFRAGNNVSCSWLSDFQPSFSLLNGRVLDLLVLL